MGTTLTGTTPQDTYDSLIKVTDNGPISGTAKYLSDGLGNDSTLALSTGNIGMGTTSLNSRLTIQGGDGLTVRNAGDTFVQLIDTTDAATNYIEFKDSTGSAANISYNHATNYMAFSVSSERMRITAAGDIGIGTSTVSAFTRTLKINTAASDANTVGILLTDGDVDRAGFYCNGGAATPAYIFTNDTKPLVFSISGAERFRMTSNGLTFNGDTAAANALDDYEEGTWTPIVVATSGTATYSTQFGSYTKIGRQVTVNWFISFQKNTLSGFISLSGLPFSLAALSGANYPQGVVMIDNLASAYDNPVIQFNNSGTDANLLTGNGSTGSHAAVSDTQLGAGTMAFRGTATYFV
jgi:hypothetical protein